MDHKDNKTRKIYIICGSILLITLSMFNFSLYYWRQFNFIKKNTVLGIQNNASKELSYWYSLTSKYPDYIIAWIEIAQLESRRGNFQAAKNAIIRAEEINPNFEGLIKIKVQLGL